MTRLGVKMLVVALPLVVSACTGGDDAADAPATIAPATSLITIPPTTTTTPPATTAGPQPEQEYLVEDGDLPVTIAAKFNVTLEELIALNDWVLEGQFVTNFPPVGTPIRIPAGGTLPGETLPQPPEETSAAADTASDESSSTVIDQCALGEYTIEAGDYPLSVAAKFDTTVDALSAANADTPGYASFAVGLVIKIPAKTTTEC